ncbi:hypothetical protein OH76DRAFT_1405684 [Lentinus brumalis]|uniref:Uncharacterized protein n=1 Tax=Lentinus brumalis TaxID=2498619 RepID=A0A371D515_9APHY|nr:hypothetical protein OH76DRAFT_1405684 [Polyporus brumalis]
MHGFLFGCLMLAAIPASAEGCQPPGYKSPACRSSAVSSSPPRPLPSSLELRIPRCTLSSRMWCTLHRGLGQG